MACPPPAPDWPLTYVIAGLFGAVCFVAGKLWGEKTGPAKNWMEAQEPPDPPAQRPD